MEITKNIDTSYKYKGYSLCFDEGDIFSHTIKEGNFDHTTLARNVLTFGADMSFSSHVTNRANNIYLFKELMVLQYMQKKTFIETLQTQAKKFALS